MELGDIVALREMAISRGSVFRMRLTPKEGVKPKYKDETYRNKYFVVLGKSGDRKLVCAVLVNSEINPNLLEEIGVFQHCIHAADYPFLKGKDRYMDCYQIKEVSYERLINEGDYVATISIEDVERAINLVKQSRVNSPAVLKKYGLK